MGILIDKTLKIETDCNSIKENAYKNQKIRISKEKK